MLDFHSPSVEPAARDASESWQAWQPLPAEQHAKPAKPHAAPSSTSTTASIMAMLDALDHGMALLDQHSRIVYANQPAQVLFEQMIHWRLQHGQLTCALPDHAQRWQEALHAACYAQRRAMLEFAMQAPEHASLDPFRLPQPFGAAANAFLRYGVLTPAGEGCHLARLIFDRRSTCSAPELQMFAGCHHLTAAETHVLEHLCQGLSPKDIATEHGVAVATVNTQIASVRNKTGVRSVRELFRAVAGLPPLRASAGVGTTTTRH